MYVFHILIPIRVQSKKYQRPTVQFQHVATDVSSSVATYLVTACQTERLAPTVELLVNWGNLQVRIV